MTSSTAKILIGVLVGLVAFIIFKSGQPSVVLSSSWAPVRSLPCRKPLQLSQLLAKLAVVAARWDQMGPTDVLYCSQCQLVHHSLT